MTEDDQVDAFWQLMHAQGPLSPEVQFLKDLEDKNGGSAGMQKFIGGLALDHPLIFSAFYKYLAACFLVIKHNPEYREKLVTTVTATIQQLLTPEGIALIEHEMKKAGDPSKMTPAEFEAHKQNLDQLISKLSPDSGEQIVVKIPEHLASFVNPQRQPKKPAYQKQSEPVFYAPSKSIVH